MGGADAEKPSRRLPRFVACCRLPQVGAAPAPRPHARAVRAERWQAAQEQGTSAPADQAGPATATTTTTAAAQPQRHSSALLGRQLEATAAARFDRGAAHAAVAAEGDFAQAVATQVVHIETHTYPKYFELPPVEVEVAAEAPRLVKKQLNPRWVGEGGSGVAERSPPGLGARAQDHLP